MNFPRLFQFLCPLRSWNRAWKIKWFFHQSICSTIKSHKGSITLSLLLGWRTYSKVDRKCYNISCSLLAWKCLMLTMYKFTIKVDDETFSRGLAWLAFKILFGYNDSMVRYWYDIVIDCNTLLLLYSTILVWYSTVPYQTVPLLFFSIVKS